jgi:phosphate transport system substrate-binding protein
MTDVLADQVDIAMVSREVSDEEAKKGAIGFPTAKDAVVPTINEKNPFYAQLVKHGITQQAATDIWINGTIKTWGQLLGTQDQTKIAVFTRSDACGAAETFAKWLGKHQEDLLGEGVNGDPGVATAVSKNPLSIGLNNIGYAYDNNTLKPLPGIRVLPVDGNNNGKIDPDEDFYASKDQITKAIAEGRYPSPPARDLYLVTKGLPTSPVVIAFLKYVLTDGQKLNAPVGYIEIPQEKLDKALAKLKK